MYVIDICYLQTDHWRSNEKVAFIRLGFGSGSGLNSEKAIGLGPDSSRRVGFGFSNLDLVLNVLYAVSQSRSACKATTTWRSR